MKIRKQRSLLKDWLQVIKCSLKFSNKRELFADIDQRNLAYGEAMFSEN
ncbi:MAG TPA: hypothetical protein VN040_10015 [Pseudosphingobacterium sp.]|nr:hypothetical protein [Pseudosphingobacterium sp.]